MIPERDVDVSYSAMRTIVSDEELWNRMDLAFPGTILHVDSSNENSARRRGS